MKRKSMLPTPVDLTLDEIQSRFGTDEKARQYLEEIRWSNGVVCPHCKNADHKRIWEIKENPEKKIRAGLYHCAECNKQFTVTVGTRTEIGRRETVNLEAYNTPKETLAMFPV